MTLVRMYFFKMSDHLIDIDDHPPHPIRRTSVPGFLEIGDFVVGINGKDSRELREKQFRLLNSKQPKNQCMFIDVLKADSSPTFLDHSTPVSLSLILNIVVGTVFENPQKCYDFFWGENTKI